MNRRLAVCITTLAALPATASAQDLHLLDAIPAWSAWLGGGSAVLLVIALTLAVGMSAKEPYYPRPRRLEPMPLYDTRGEP